MEERTAGIIRGTVLLLALLLIAAAVAWRWLGRSHDRGRLLARWAISLVVLFGLITLAAPGMAQGGASAIGGLMVALVLGLGLAILWTPSLAAMISRPFEAMFTGGEQPPEPEANYSTALARRHQGQHREALYEIQAQLARFPQDPAGHLLMAEIQAENLRDLPAAEITIRKLCGQPGQTRGTIALAWNSLADWHLSVGRDAESARAALAQIVEAFPHSEQALQAEQRLAHLPDQERLEKKDACKTIPMRIGVRNLGLKKICAEDLIHHQTPEEAAEEQVRRLTEHPFDTEAREKLALLYAGELGQLDQAIEQLEQMASHPAMSAKQVAHFLHRLADVHVRFGGDAAQGRAALQRIIDLFPNTAYATQAQERMFTLANELHRPDQAPIKMGVYERYLGLKQKPPLSDAAKTETGLQATDERG